MLLAYMQDASISLHSQLVQREDEVRETQSGVYLVLLTMYIISVFCTGEPFDQSSI